MSSKAYVYDRSSNSWISGEQAGVITPSGLISPFAGVNQPAGWLFCFGQTLNAVTSPQFQSLYNSIGNAYGGTNNSNFAVPDLRGRTAAGVDNMGGTDAGRLDWNNTLGNAGGQQNVSTSNHEHYHFSPIGLNSGTNMIINPSSGLMDGLGSYNIYDIQTGSGQYAGSGTVAYERWYVTSSSNGSQSLTNMQPTILLNYIIKI